MAEGECTHGRNGCVTLQDTVNCQSKLKVQQNVNTKDITDLWKSVSEIKALLFKAVIFMGAITAGIQTAFKFWH